MNTSAHAAPEAATHTTAELLLHLPLAYSEPGNAAFPDAQARIRKGFDAVIAALRRQPGIPAADIAALVDAAAAGARFDEIAAPVAGLTSKLPDEEFFNALRESGMLDGLDLRERPAPALPPHHPKFVEAMERLNELQELHGDAVVQMPENRQLWDQAVRHAPPLFLQAIREVAAEMKMLPETKFVDASGQPVYSAEQIADMLGMPVNEVLNDIAELFGDRLPERDVFPVQ